MLLQIAQPLLLAGVVPLVEHGATREFLQRHLDHSKWDGVSYLDLGLPGYIVVMGVSLQLALDRARARGARGRELITPTSLRVLLLIALGIVCNGGLSQPWPNVRLVGVLQRLAICYAFCSAVGWKLRWRGQAALLGALLVGYWMLMRWVPFPGMGDARFDGLANLAVYVDQSFLPGQKLYGSWDPEGLLTTIPALATSVAGLLLARLLVLPLTHSRRLLALLAVGAACIGSGKLWAAWFPINKYLWTSSFVLVAIGAIAVHLALLWLISEVWNGRHLLFPLLVYGRHSLVAYVSDQLIDLEWIALSLVGGSVALFFGKFAGLLLALTVIAIQWSFLLWLDRRRAVASESAALPVVTSARPGPNAGAARTEVQTALS